MTKNMDMVSYNMPTMTNIREIGKTDKELDKASINIQMATFIQVNGQRI
jgi:hypothetical protein